jgi:N-acetylglucosaminyl-diphospho-decaprenol L-rhamnosyltransferase
MSGPEPTVYIPTLSGGEKLQRCLDSLQSQTVPTQVVVADNGEGEGSAAMLAERFPQVTRVGFGRNLGFGPALNRAIREVGEGPIVLLNDDAVAEPQLIEMLLAGSERAELVAAVLLSERDPSRIDSAGVMIDQTLMAFDYLCGEPAERLGKAGPPLGPTGGAALYDRDAFNAVDGFDERIFLYYEDVDLALRMRGEGARCALAPAARAVHGYSLTLGAGSARKHAMTGWSRGYLMRRYGITARPSLAAQGLAREVAICAGQLLRSRTLAGARGRIEGWRAGKDLPPRALPPGAAERLSLGRALALRNSGHSA